MSAKRLGGGFLLAWLTVPAMADDVLTDAALYDQAMHSVVRIIAKKPDATGCGTGVLIDPVRRYVLTAQHVVDGATDIRAFFADRDGDGEVIADPGYYPQDDPAASNQCTLVAMTICGDLALLQLPPLPPTARPMAVAVKSSRPGSRLLLIGNAGLAGPLWRFSSGSLRQVYRGVLNPDFCDQPTRLLETTIAGLPGDSGGPIFNRRCELVGIYTNRHTEVGIGYGTDIMPIRELLLSRDTNLTEHLAGQSEITEHSARLVYGIKFFPAGQPATATTHVYWAAIDAEGRCTLSLLFPPMPGPRQAQRRGLLPMVSPMPGSVGNPAVVNGGLPK